MKIAIGGIATENSTFSVWQTRLEDFTIVRAAAMLSRYPTLDQYEDMTFTPIVRAAALPGGPVDPTAYDQIKAELINGLREGAPWDGVYLDMHGAMNVFGREDAEGDWMESVRQAVGPDCIISASYDLHGNVSERVFDNLDLLTAFRTAPHLDYQETMDRAIDMLVTALRSGTRPAKRRFAVPIALPGEKTSTEWEPGASLYKELDTTLAVDGVLDASILIGYAWADEPRASGVVTVYGTDQAAVDAEAVRLAQAFWDVRAEFQFGVPVGTSDEVIQMALNAPEDCVFISDSGDNPTAGGVGDVTYTLGRLIALDVPSAVYASIPDADAVAECFNAGIGETVSLSIGGKWDTAYSEPLAISGEIIRLETFPWKSTESGLDNRQAVVQVGGVKVILTERRTPFHYIKQFQQLGIAPLEHKLVVIKIGYLVPDLKQAAPNSMLALSPGAVNQALEQLPYKRIQRPIYPLDPDMTWAPTL